jgi:MORN repeat
MGKRHGYGVYDDKTEIYKGGWRNGKKHGVGEMKFYTDNGLDVKDGYSGYW